MFLIAQKNPRKQIILGILSLLVMTSGYAQNNDILNFSLNDGQIIDVQKIAKDIDINIDGKLDEPIWSNITVHDNYLIIKPDSLQKPKYSTHTRFFYTVDGFYISMDMEQPNNSLIKRYKSRDDWQTKSDKAGFSIDTSGEAKYAYWFSKSLGDSEADGTLAPEDIYSVEVT